jgi:uncharacterized membrane protein
MNSVASLGRFFYAAAVACYGAELFVFAHFPRELASSWPPWMPGTPAIEYGAGAILISAAGAILFGKRPRTAATLLGSLFLMLILLRSIPLIVENPSSSKNPNGDACEASAVCAGALLVAGSLSPETFARAKAVQVVFNALGNIVPLGRFLLALPMIYFGYAHIRYSGYVATLVPGWIPWHPFWAYFCGAALIAAGIGILLNILTRWASMLSGAMILLFGALVNVPLALAALRNVDLWTSTFHTLAWSGAAFALAGTAKDSRKMGTA